MTLTRAVPGRLWVQMHRADDLSDVKRTSSVDPLDVRVPGVVLPLAFRSCGEAAVPPSYTNTKS